MDFLSDILFTVLAHRIGVFQQATIGRLLPVVAVESTAVSCPSRQAEIGKKQLFREWRGNGRTETHSTQPVFTAGQAVMLDGLR
jgi:hypothetical protein